jgi:hypothetical protein
MHTLLKIHHEPTISLLLLSFRGWSMRNFSLLSSSSNLVQPELLSLPQSYLSIYTADALMNKA